jgi:hypothetical protein
MRADVLKEKAFKFGDVIYATERYFLSLSICFYSVTFQIVFFACLFLCILLLLDPLIVVLPSHCQELVTQRLDAVED